MPACHSRQLVDSCPGPWPLATNLPLMSLLLRCTPRADFCCGLFFAESPSAGHMLDDGARGCSTRSTSSSSRSRRSATVRRAKRRPRYQALQRSRPSLSAQRRSATPLALIVQIDGRRGRSTRCSGSPPHDAAKSSSSRGHARSSADSAGSGRPSPTSSHRRGNGGLSMVDRKTPTSSARHVRRRTTWLIVAGDATDEETLHRSRHRAGRDADRRPQRATPTASF